MNATQTTTAAELFELLKKFNRGVRGVEIKYGIIEVSVSSAKAATGVTVDLLRSRAFKSVKAVPNQVSRGFLVHAIPA